MTFFEDKHQREGLPLSARMRPTKFDLFLGQEHIIGPERALRKAIESDKLPSIILWGPPGSGKTTLAYIISEYTKSYFESISAVTAGVANLRNIIEQAQKRLAFDDKRTIIFIDEIHRFNKTQQDVILPHVENGILTLIGATTENPSFEVISALLSRSHIFRLHQLSQDELTSIITRAKDDDNSGLGQLKVSISPEALNFLVNISNGDARIALNALETAAHATDADKHGHRIINLHTIEDTLQKRHVTYDKSGDNHYDTISAFIKSIRGSSPDGAIYWLARMLEAGEDPMFICRRLIILASEDIGLADPMALTVAVSTQQAVHFVGMPEARFALSEATLYLATCPKSNSSLTALNMASEEIENTVNEPVPLHLRNPVTRLGQNMGHGAGYKYPHDSESHFIYEEYLPSSIKNNKYYHPSEQGQEKSISERLKSLWAKHSNSE